jgi:hypothetical protein
MAAIRARTREALAGLHQIPGAVGLAGTALVNRAALRLGPLGFDPRALSVSLPLTLKTGLRPPRRQGQDERRGGGGLDGLSPLIGAGLVRLHTQPCELNSGKSKILKIGPRSTGSRSEAPALSLLIDKEITQSLWVVSSIAFPVSYTIYDRDVP